MRPLGVVEATTDLGMRDCIGPFVADAASKVSSIATSRDEKLGIVDFSNARVSFFSVSFIPSTRCSN